MLFGCAFWDTSARLAGACPDGCGASGAAEFEAVEQVVLELVLFGDWAGCAHELWGAVRHDADAGVARSDTVDAPLARRIRGGCSLAGTVAAAVSRLLMPGGGSAQGATISMPISAMSVAGGGVVFLVCLAVAVRLRQRRRPKDTLVRYARAVSALRAIVEHPQPTPSSLAPDGPIPDTHVRLAVPPTSPHQRVIRKAPTGRRTARPDLAVVARRPTVANLPSISSPTIPSPDADARTSSAPVRVRDERDGLIGA